MNFHYNLLKAVNSHTRILSYFYTHGFFLLSSKLTLFFTNIRILIFCLIFQTLIEAYKSKVIDNARGRNAKLGRKVAIQSFDAIRITQQSKQHRKISIKHIVGFFGELGNFQRFCHRHYAHRKSRPRIGLSNNGAKVRNFFKLTAISLIIN